jgi:predicted amidohydrolase
MNDLNIAILQLCSTDEVAGNQREILEVMGYLKEPSSLDVVFMPENSLYIRIDRSQQHEGLLAGDPVFAPFQQFAKRHQCHLLFGSNPMQSENGIANSTVWINSKGEVITPYTKIHLFDVDVEGQKPVRESDDFVAGGLPAIIEIEGWRIGLSICYDIRFSELFLHYAKQGVDLIAIPSAFLQPTGEAHWQVLQRARAIESQCYVVSSAQAGRHQSESTGSVRHSYGHSIVVDPWGRVMADLGVEVGSQQLTLKKELLSKVRAQIPMANHRRL